MTSLAYHYRFVESTVDVPPSERTECDTHSEIITLYDTDRHRLEKVAVIHDPNHFGDNVKGIRDHHPYPETDCPCYGGDPPVRAWNGDKIMTLSFEDWAANPDVPVLYLDP